MNKTARHIKTLTAWMLMLVPAALHGGHLLNQQATTELTIAAGAITVTQNMHTVEGQGAAADNLDTITGLAAGHMVWLSPANAAHNITITDGVGNIDTPDGNSYTIPDDGYVIAYSPDSTNVIVIYATTAASISGVLLANGTIPLTAAWDVGAFVVTALNYVSDVAIGTQPYACTSTTVNTNLNADLLDGEHASAFEDSDADLTAIAALAGTGVLAHTGAGTWAERTITGTANQVVVANGDGVAGNPTLSVPQDIHTAATPQFGKLGLGVAADGTAQLKLAFDAAAYMLVTQADAAAVTFDSVSDGTAGFAFSDAVTVSTATPACLTLGNNGDVDFALTFDANTTDGVLTWMEDETYFGFTHALLLGTTADTTNGILRYTGADLEIRIGGVWVSTTAGAAGGEANTCSNAGSGVSVYFQKAGIDLELNAIKSENDRISVALDGATHDIELTLEEANLDMSNMTGTVAEANGGTGAATWNKGDIIYASAANTLAALADGTVGNVLTQADEVPAWQDPGWYALAEDTDWNDDPPSTSTITTISDLSTIIKVGTPLKFTLGGGAANPGTYYAVVTAMAVNLITIAGAPLETDDGDLTALWIGRPERVAQVDLFIAGTYGDGVDTTLLASDMSSYFKWGGSAAYLVMYECVHLTVDTGAEPKINVRVNGADVSTNDANNGVQLGATATWVANSAVAINTTNYDIQRGEPLELHCPVAGGTGDAAELTVTCFFVFE
ncbi:MAG: hypothetical protein GY851_35360 [bacterium]|nr:hypothetical protein [bacterium]